MNTTKTKDVLATVIGGGTGVDLFWTGLEGITNSLHTDAPLKVADCKLLVYGCIAAYLGYLAWRDERRHMVSETPTVNTKEAIKNDTSNDLSNKP